MPAEGLVEKVREKYSGQDVSKLHSTDPVAAKILAKDDYLLFLSPAVICRRYGMSAYALHQCIHDRDPITGGECWNIERARRYNEIFDKALKDSHEAIKNILGLGTSNLKRTLEALLVREDPLTLNEAHKLSGIIAEMNKIIRLEEGKATDIHAHIDTSPEGVRKLVDELQEVDPYVDYSKKVLN